MMSRRQNDLELTMGSLYFLLPFRSFDFVSALMAINGKLVELSLTLASLPRLTLPSFLYSYSP